MKKGATIWMSGTKALGPVGKTQGLYKFMSLRTGRLIVCHNFDELPVTEEIIAQVKHFVDAQKQLDMLEFCDCNQVSIPNKLAELDVYHNQLTGVDNDDNDGNNSDNDSSGGSNDINSGNNSSGASNDNNNNSSGDTNDNGNNDDNSSREEDSNEPNEQDISHTGIDTAKNDGSHRTATHNTNLETNDTINATTIIPHNDDTFMAQP
eukprot:15343091-Ditylum_brightwellii.AAC.2